MADNVGITPGTGAIIAADDIGGVLHQRAKVQFGGDGEATDVSSASPLPVAVSGVSTEATLSALKASIDALSAKVSSCNTNAVVLDAATLAALETINASISGSVSVSNFTDNGLTDAQLRAAAVPVACSDLATLVDALHQEDTPHTSGHYGQLMLGIRSDSDAPTADNGDYTVLKLDEEGRLKVASKPASYVPTVGNVTSATSAVSINCERFSNLMIHCTGTFAGVNCTFEGSLNSTNGTDGNWFTVQAIRSNANTIETTTGVLAAAPAYAWELSVNALKYFRVRATAWTSGTQVWTMIPGTYATEPIPGAQASATQAVSGTVTATNTTPTPLNTSSAATTNPVLVKGSAGTLFSISASNVGASAAYLKLYNKATAPTVGADVPVLTIPIPSNSVVPISFGTLGHRFATGIGFGITGAAADNDTTAVAAAQVKVLTSYV